MLAFSLLASAYLGALALNAYVLKLDWVLLGVLQELLTLPTVAGVAAGFVFSAARLLTNRQAANAGSIGATLILFVLNCLIWGSFAL